MSTRSKVIIKSVALAGAAAAVTVLFRSKRRQ
jgi:hypothetical protein